LSLILSLLLAAPAQAGPVWTLVMPLGVPQFTHQKPLRGLAYGGAQAALGGVAVWSSLEMREAALTEDFERELPLRMVSAIAIGGFAATWLASSIDGSRLHDQEMLDNELSWRSGAYDALPAHLARPVAPVASASLSRPALNLSAGFTDPEAWPAYSLENSPLNSPR